MKHVPSSVSLLLFALALFISARAAEAVTEPAPAAPNEPAPTTMENPPPPPSAWLVLKDATYDQRDSFLAGVKDLETQVDQQIGELVTQRAAMAKANISTNAWDLLMQEMNTARTNLKSTIDDMRSASRETWEQQKNQVGLAWERTQNAYTRVKASTTS
jgi:hypothetical protein